MIPPKDHDNFLVTDPPLKYGDLQIAWQRSQNNCFEEAQWTTENTDRHVNEIRRIIHEQNKMVQKDIKIKIRTKQILELKITVNKKKILM